MPDYTPPSSGGSGGAPSGSAGGALQGSYPNPDFDSARTGYGRGTGTFETIPWFTMNNGVNWTSGNLILGYFTAPYSKSITTLSIGMGTAGATGSVTIGKIALFAANTDGTTSAGPLVVSTNDTTLGTGASNLYTATVTSTALTGGTRYAIAALLVHSFTTLPKYASITSGLVPSVQGITPKTCAVVTGQSDMPAGAIASVAVLTQPAYFTCA